jgi:hypothetical protein
MVFFWQQFSFLGTMIIIHVEGGQSPGGSGGNPTYRLRMGKGIRQIDGSPGQGDKAGAHRLLVKEFICRILPAKNQAITAHRRLSSNASLQGAATFHSQHVDIALGVFKAGSTTYTTSTKFPDIAVFD